MKYFNVFEYLTPKASTNYFDADCTLLDALEKFDDNKYSVVPIIDKDGNFVSTISDGDVLRYLKNELHFDLSKAKNILVKDIPHYRPYQTLSVLTTPQVVCVLSLEQNFVPILDDRQKFIGIVKRKTIIQYLFQYMDNK